MHSNPTTSHSVQVACDDDPMETGLAPRELRTHVAIGGTHAISIDDATNCSSFGRSITMITFIDRRGLRCLLVTWVESRQQPG
jgi:hypothetical protein